MIFYDAQSINPFNNHPARQVKHKVKDCPLLNDWGGKIAEDPYSHKPRCPFCFNKATLKKVRRAERHWNLIRPSVLVNFLNSYLELTKSKKTLEKETDNF